MPRLTALLWRVLGKVLERRQIDMLAESCFRKAIEATNSDAESRLDLGRMLLAQKRYAAALQLLEEAVTIKADSANCWNALGVARRETDDMQGAADAFRRALAANPDLIHAHNNLGNWYLAAGAPEEALRRFEGALAIDAGFYETLNNRIVALLDLARNQEAETFAKQALETFPESAPLHLNLGNSYLQQGRGYLALKSYERALALDPNFEEAHFNHALLEGTAEHLGRAITFLKKEVALRGRSVDLLNRLAIAHMANQSFGDAEEICREIIAKQPDFAPAYISLGNALSVMGDATQSLRAYEQAARLKPDDSWIGSNAVFEINYCSDYSSDLIFEKHLEWATCHEKPLLQPEPARAQARDKNRRLKIGYISPDFQSHPVGFLTRGVIRHHDKSAYEVYCYARVTKSDHITDEIRKNAERWIDTGGLRDAELVQRIADDEIDILVDLSGHTGGNRLQVFARRPAPIQATWVGYFHSTGMKSIDYFITDPYTSPKNSGQRFSETPVWLPHTRFCYTPPDYAPPVAEPPCIANGFVTLGCFNKLAKMTDEVVSAWAQILARLPEARLWLKSSSLNEPAVCKAVFARFAAFGISSERVILKPASPHEDMLKEYSELDIALDPFPFSGGMTTFEALYMGVPVVTLGRDGVVTRQSASALSNLGLAELSHETIPNYIDGVVALASNQQRLIELRRTIRPRMERSPLCDIETFAHDLENLYRHMWYAWCDGTSLPSDLESQSNGGER